MYYSTWNDAGSVPDYPRVDYMLHDFGDVGSRVVGAYAHKATSIYIPLYRSEATKSIFFIL